MTQLIVILLSGSVVKDTDLVIEAIVENMAVKHRLFKELDSVAPQVKLYLK